MKHFSIYVFVFYCMFLFITSCKTDSPDTPEVPDNEVLCTTDSLMFTSAKDASLIIVNSTNTWIASTESNWIHVSATSGNGKTAILVGADINNGFSRSALITLVSGSVKHSIKVNQEGADKVSLIVNNVSFALVLVKGATFVMGEELNNSPAHNVTLTDYYICQTEVTNELWKAVMGSLPYDTLSGYSGVNQHNYPKWPVTGVSWNLVNSKFLSEIKAKLGYNFRLPTEAEWEFAALGGIKSKGYNFSGSNLLDDVGWDTQYSSNTKHDVAYKNPNELDLYDMSGNASEWCSDWYEYNYSTSNVLLNPQGPSSGTFKVLRGGSFQSEAGLFGYNECRTKQRKYLHPSGYQGAWGNTGSPDEPIIFTCNPVGFRFVLTPKK